MGRSPKGVPFNRQLTLRGIIIGAIGSAVVTASSTYVALRLGALPWPTVFVAILSLSVLRLLGHTNINEVNVTHTAMSAGGLVAGGFAFTVPAIWMLNPTAQESIWRLLSISLCGALLGLAFTAMIRPYFIEGERLPYPMGIAASETLKAGYEGGARAGYLFGALSIAAIVTALRDQFGKIPAAIVSQTLTAKNVFFSLWISPMAVGIGYIIGPLYMGTWFLGACVSYFFLIPVGLFYGWFLDVASAEAFKNSLGIGLVVGSGIGVLVKGVIPRAREIFAPLLRGTRGRASGSIAVLLAAIIVLLSWVGLIPLGASILLVLCVWVTTSMAATLTGQTGIDPMEIFGILALLAIRLVVPLDATEAILLAAVVAIASGVAGDVLQDFKAGYLLRTDPKAQLISEGVGVIVGALVSVLALYTLHRAYGAMGPGTALVAPQAYAVSAMVQGLPNPQAFGFGLAIGIILYFLGIPGMTLGIGVYLPMAISSAAGIGGLTRLLVDRFAPAHSEKGTLIGSGFLGGEGATGMILAIIKVITGG